MIQCPNCKATLPDWQTECQFCHADTKKVARPVKQAYHAAKSFDPPKWVWPAYYGIACWWIIDGGMTIVNTFLYVAEAKAKAAAATNELERALNEPSVFSYFPVVIGVFTILFAIGLMLRNNTVRGIVNFFSFLKLVIGLCGIVGTLFAGMIFGPWALIHLIGNVFTIFTAAMLIYLIGETDKYAFV